MQLRVWVKLEQNQFLVDKSIFFKSQKLENKILLNEKNQKIILFSEHCENLEPKTQFGHFWGGRGPACH